MKLPRLHVVTDDAVLRDASFPDRARDVVQALGPRGALHLRGHRTPPPRLWGLAETLAAQCGRSGAAFVVNDRADLALACGARGVQLGRRSMPIAAARALLGPRGWIGYSAHDAGEALRVAAAGADFIVAGAVYETSSHPRRAAGGLTLVRACTAAGVPILAIGGITPQRVGEAVAAGAYGVAVLGGVWSAADPAAAVAAYLAALRDAD